MVNIFVFYSFDALLDAKAQLEKTLHAVFKIPDWCLKRQNCIKIKLLIQTAEREATFF